MKIRITPGALLLLAALAFDKSGMLGAALFAAAWHEAGHLAAARVLGIRLRRLELDLLGARLFPAQAIRSYRAEAILAAAGPAASLMLGFVFHPVVGVFAKKVLTATYSLALFNLLPVRGFDGGRVLGARLAARLDTETAERVLAVTSYLSLFFLFTLSACFLLRYGEQLALAVLSASLFVRLYLVGENQRL